MGNFSMKLASTVSATAIVASAMSASLVSAASEFLPYAEALAKNKVINTSSTEAGYRLNDYITRAELAKVAANLGRYTTVSCTGNVYTDVNKSLGDLCDAIETLAAAKVISTSTSTFRPEASVTRAEMTKMILGSLGETQSTVSAGYMDVTDSLGDLAGFINRAAENGIVNKATYFRPNANGSRGEIFKIAARAAKIESTTPLDPSHSGSTTTPSTNGTVSVSIVGSASAQYVPENASSVNVGTFKLTATNGDVTINSVTLGRSGLGNSRFVSLSLADKSGRISETRTVNSSTQEAVIRLNNPITLKKGQSVELSALVSVDGQANAQHQFAVRAVNGTTITPVTLGLINTTSYKTSEVTVNSVSTSNVTSGRNDQTFARVSLRAGNQDTTISGFTLTKTAGSDLTRAFSNVNVYRNGTKVGKATVTSDKIIVSELATDLARNNSTVYELRGDVVYVGGGETITLGLTESTDVAATEKSTGFTTKVAGTPQSGDIALSALDISVSKNAVPTKTVAPGTSNVLFLDANIKAQTSFDVTKFTLENSEYLAGTATDSNVFGSLILTVNGVDYDLLDANGAVRLKAGAGTSSLVFQSSSDKFRVEAGTPVSVQIRGSLLNTKGIEGKLKYKLVLNTVKNINSGNTTTITKSVTGDAITVEAPTLTLRQSTVAAPSGNKIFSNATDLEIGRFGVEAKADEISVNKIVVENVASADKIAKFGDVFTSARLINVADGSTVASSADIQDTSFTFNSVNLRVAKNTTTNVKLVVDTNGSLVNGVATTGKNFTAQVTINDADISATTASTATASPTSLDTSKEYTISINAPTVKVDALSLLQASPVARVTVTNTDSNNAVKLKEVKLRVNYRSTANGTAPSNITEDMCLRNVGSSASCGSNGTLVAGTPTSGVYTLTIDGSSLAAAADISKNNGTADFEIFLPNAPVWVAGDNVSVVVTELTYDAGSTTDITESYVGVAGASATATK